LDHGDCGKWRFDGRLLTLEMDDNSALSVHGNALGQIDDDTEHNRRRAAALGERTRMR
jgi:hypothetical protein